MPDFPVGLPDIPQANVSETLFTMHDGDGHVPSTNRILANLGAVCAKVGYVASTPGAVPAVLKRFASGQSVWGPVTPAEIAGSGGGDANKVLLTADGTAASFAKVSGNATATGQIAPASIAPGDLRGAGGANANMLLRSTNGTDVAFGKLTNADITPGVVPWQVLATKNGDGVSPIISFSSPTDFPQTFRELRILLRGQCTGTGGFVSCGINFEASPLASQYFYQRAYSIGASGGHQEILGTAPYIFIGAYPTGGSAGALDAVSEILLPDYTNARYKTLLVRAAGYGAPPTSSSQANDSVTGFLISGAPITLIKLVVVAGTPFWSTITRATLMGA